MLTGDQGVYGAYFSKLNYRWSKDVRNGKWLGKHPKSEVVIITLITALLSFLNPYTRMGGTELVYNLFAECRPGEHHGGLCVFDSAGIRPLIKAITVALVVKGALTIVTFGIKVPAGIFIPTLGVGACAGRILGFARKERTAASSPACMPWWGLPPHYRGSRYVLPKLCRTRSLKCFWKRTTVSLAVIMFELTGTLTYVAPVMLSVLVAKTVADALEPKGIYDLVIEYVYPLGWSCCFSPVNRRLNQLPYLDYKAEYRWGVKTVADVVSTIYVVCYAIPEPCRPRFKIDGSQD